MNPAHRLGVALRRLGTVTGIVKVRADQAEREAHNGGQLADLNGKLAQRACEVDRIVSKVERKLT